MLYILYFRGGFRQRRPVCLPSRLRCTT